MDANEIKKLEEKFWQGKTSLEEEKQLKSLTEAEKKYISEGLRSYLTCSVEEKKTGLTDDFDALILSQIENKTRVRRMFTMYDLARVAAVIAIVFTLAYFSYNTLTERADNRQELAEDTFEDPEKAFEETRKALIFAAGMMNKGLEPAAELSKFHETEVAIQSADDVIENDTIKQ